MTQSKIRFSMSIRPEPSEEELLFARQLGIPCVYTWVSPEQRSYAYLARLRERLRELGAQRKQLGRIRYWDLKPDFQPGEVIWL